MSLLHYCWRSEYSTLTPQPQTDSLAAGKTITSVHLPTPTPRLPSNHLAHSHKNTIYHTRMPSYFHFWLPYDTLPSIHTDYSLCFFASFWMRVFAILFKADLAVYCCYCTPQPQTDSLAAGKTITSVHLPTPTPRLPSNHLAHSHKNTIYHTRMPSYFHFWLPYDTLPSIHPDYSLCFFASFWMRVFAI